MLKKIINNKKNALASYILDARAYLSEIRIVLAELIVGYYHIYQTIMTYINDFHYISLFFVSSSNVVFIISALNKSKTGLKLSSFLVILSFCSLLAEVNYRNHVMDTNIYGCWFSIFIMSIFLFEKHKES